MALKIVVADDHPMIQMGVRLAFENELGFEICGCATNSTELIDILDHASVDVLISDFYMPGGKYGDGMTLVSLVRRRYPEIRVIILTMMSNPAILQSIVGASGIDGILLKSSAQDEIVAAVHAVANGETYIGKAVREAIDQIRANHLTPQGKAAQTALSPKESEVLRLFVGGHTVSEIAAILHRSVKTVSHQKISAQQKLGVSTDKDLYEYALQNGLL